LHGETLRTQTQLRVDPALSHRVFVVALHFSYEIPRIQLSPQH